MLFQKKENQLFSFERSFLECKRKVVNGCPRSEHGTSADSANGIYFASYGGSRIMIDRRKRAYEDIQAERAAMPGLRNIIGSGQPLDREGVQRKKS